MKYLKMFNENISIEEIKDFCKSHLSYLLDENQNLELIINNDSFSKKNYIFSLRTPISIMEYFYWNDIKDEFIPFLEIFRKKYTIIDNNISFIVINSDIARGASRTYKSIYKVDDVLDGIMDDNFEYYSGFDEQIKLKVIHFYFKV